MFPTFIRKQFLRIWQHCARAIPEKWKSLAGFFGFGEGDIATGFNQIEQYRRKVQNIAGLNDEAVMFSFANMFFSFEQNMPADIMKAIRETDAPAVR